MGDCLLDREFESYCDVLRKLGYSADREMWRELQSDGSYYLHGGRIGIVSTRPEAEKILAELTKQVPNILWRIEEMP
jgi:hypothetical protein